MFMYKLELTLEDREVVMIVIAENDQKAFDSVEASLARHYIKLPVLNEAVIIEKKRVEKGSAFIIDAAR